LACCAVFAALVALQQLFAICLDLLFDALLKVPALWCTEIKACSTFAAAL